MNFMLMIKRSELLLFEIRKKLETSQLDLVQASLFLQLYPMHGVGVLLKQASCYYLQKLLDSISVLPVLVVLVVLQVLLMLIQPIQLEHSEH